MAKGLCKYGAAALFIFLSGMAGAQNYAGWRLYHAEGDIVLTSRGSRTIYKSGSSEFTGTLLRSQDMIQTGSGGAEIQLVPEDPAAGGNFTVLKLGENTSLLVDSLESKEPSLEIFYGRIRVVGGAGLGGSGSAVAIRSGNSLTTLRDADAALDYVTRPGVTQPALAVHCFKGQGELAPLIQPGADVSKLPVRAGETLALEYRIPFSYVERRPLDPQVLSFWREEAFSAAAPLAAPSTELYREAAETTSYMPPSAPPPDDKYKKVRKGYAITGILLSGAGLAMQGYSFFGGGSRETQDMFFYGGYGPLGLGITFLFVSALLP